MRNSRFLSLKRLVLVLALLVLGLSVSAAQISVSLPTAQGQQGTSVTIPITVGDLTGQGVIAFQFTVTFDTTIVKITGVSSTGTLSSGMTITPNATISGQIRVGAATTQALSGSGTLINLVGNLVGKGTSALTFTAFLFNEGTPAATVTNGSVIVPQLAARITDVTLKAVAGAAVTVPIATDDVTGLNVLSYQFSVSFDTTIIRLTGVSTEGTKSAGMTVVPNTNVSGRITVGAAGTVALSGSGTLVNLVGTVVKAGTSDVKFLSIQYNEGIPAVGGVDGKVTITTNSAPAFVKKMADTTVAENQALTYTYTASDLDNDPLTFSLVNAPTGAAITSAGAFSWTPAYDQAGAYTITAVVSDGMLTDTARSRITVTSVNRKPAFVNKMADKTIAENEPLTFTYTATDPDNDPLTFSLVSPPAGAAITSAGVFAWTPTYAQAGSYTIVAVVSDGALADTAKSTVTVTNVNRKPVFNFRVPAIVSTVSFNKPFTFAVSATDPDGDKLTFTWKLDGIVQTGTDSAFTKTFPGPHGAPHSVVAVFQDPGGLKDSTKWGFTITDVEDQEMIPTEFALGQNYPNPFNPSTTIEFALPAEVHVTLEVYNILGVKVRTLVHGEVLQAAFHRYTWDGKDDSGVGMPTGVYLYRIHAGSFYASRKMTLMK